MAFWRQRGKTFDGMPSIPFMKTLLTTQRFGVGSVGAGVQEGGPRGPRWGKGVAIAHQQSGP